MAKTIALIGTPNCGKTTFFNFITGKRSKTGNWPGVTVEKEIGKLKSKKDFNVIDLPGTYTLSPYSIEEKVTCDYIKEQNYDFAICVIDSTNPEPGIYLAAELASLNLPFIVALNYYDEVIRSKEKVYPDKLSVYLEREVFPVSAKTGIGIDKLLSRIYSYKDFGNKHSFNYSETDRHKLASKIVSECFVKNQKLNGFSEKADHYMTESGFSALICALVIGIIFFLMFGFPGAVLKTGIENIFSITESKTAAIFSSLKVSEAISSLFVDGIMKGAFSVIGFLPQLAIFFAVSAFLEDSGYLARAAFISDRFMQSIGLNGRAIIPLLLGFGCTVPAVIATKSSSSKADKMNTIAFLPFIPCSAKLPVCFLIADYLFPKHIVLTMLVIFCFTIGLGCVISKSKAQKCGSFILELPRYRFPTAKSVLKSTFYRCRSFISKISTVIVLVSTAIWFTTYFAPDFTKAVSIEESIICYIGKFIEPIFLPIGLSWKAAVALFSGLAAKEASLSVLMLISGGDISNVFTLGSGISFLIFFTLYSPCFAALSTIKKEAGTSAALKIFCFHTALAYSASLLFYQMYMLISNIFF